MSQAGTEVGGYHIKRHDNAAVFVGGARVEPAFQTHEAGADAKSFGQTQQSPVGRLRRKVMQRHNRREDGNKSAERTDVSDPVDDFVRNERRYDVTAVVKGKDDACFRGRNAVLVHSQSQG